MDLLSPNGNLSSDCCSKNNCSRWKQAMINLIRFVKCTAVMKKHSDVRSPELVHRCDLCPIIYLFLLKFIGEGSPNWSKKLSFCCECLSVISLDVTSSRWTGEMTFMSLLLFFPKCNQVINTYIIMRKCWSFITSHKCPFKRDKI